MKSIVPDEYKLDNITLKDLKILGGLWRNRWITRLGDAFLHGRLHRKHYLQHVTFRYVNVISDSLYCAWPRFHQIYPQTSFQNEWEIRFLPTHQFLWTVQSVRFLYCHFYARVLLFNLTKMCPFILQYSKGVGPYLIRKCWLWHDMKMTILQD